MNVGNVRVGGTRCTEITGEVTSVTEDAGYCWVHSIIRVSTKLCPSSRHQSWTRSVWGHVATSYSDDLSATRLYTVVGGCCGLTRCLQGFLKPPIGYDCCGKVSQFHVYFLSLNTFLVKCLDRFLVVKDPVLSTRRSKGLHWGLWNFAKVGWQL